MLRRFPHSHSNTAASVYSSSECGYLLLLEGFRPVYGQANRVDIAKTKTHVSNLLVRNAREACSEYPIRLPASAFSMQVNEPIAGAADDDHRRHSPEQ
jgi:hypothetical protein